MNTLISPLNITPSMLSIDHFMDKDEMLDVGLNTYMKHKKAFKALMDQIDHLAKLINGSSSESYLPEALVEIDESSKKSIYSLFYGMAAPLAEQLLTDMRNSEAHEYFIALNNNAKQPDFTQIPNYDQLPYSVKGHGNQKDNVIESLKNLVACIDEACGISADYAVRLSASQFSRTHRTLQQAITRVIYLSALNTHYLHKTGQATIQDAELLHIVQCLSAIGMHFPMI